MKQKIHIKYLNTQLNIGIVDLKNVYSISPALMKLIPEVYKGNLVYRIPGTSKRIAYDAINKGIIKKSFSRILYLPF